MMLLQMLVALVLLLASFAAFSMLESPDILQGQDDSSSTLRRMKEAGQNPRQEADGTLVVQRNSAIHPCAYYISMKGEEKLETSDPITKIHLHFDDCAEHQLGNRIGEHYHRMLIADAARVPYKMTCGDSDDVMQTTNPTHTTPVESVLKYLEIERLGNTPIDPYDQHIWTPEEVCKSCHCAGWSCSKGLNLMAMQMRHDFIRMALNSTAGQTVSSEDAVIHLRLGDALKGEHDEHIGLLPNKAYSDLLLRAQEEFGTLRTIGIVTQPWDRKLARSFDSRPKTLEKSRSVALELHRHLEEVFPDAMVLIHNDVSDTPLKSYARLVKAEKAAICGASTFCTYPVLANVKGKGYLFRGEKHSPWAQRAAELMPTMETFKVPRLTNNYINRLEIQEIIRWLRLQSPDAGEMIIDGPPLIRAEAPQGGINEIAVA